MWRISAGSGETAPTQRAATTAHAFPGTRRRERPSSRPTMAPNAPVTSGFLVTALSLFSHAQQQVLWIFLDMLKVKLFSTPAFLVEQHLQVLLIFLYWLIRFAGFWSWFMNISCIFYARWNHSLSSKRNYAVFGIKWGWLSLLLGTVLLLFFTHLQAGRRTITTTSTIEMCVQGKLASSL